MISIDKNGVVTVRKTTEEELSKQIERARFDARCREASALYNAERRGEEAARAKWENMLVDKDALIADKDALIAELRSRLDEK